MSDITKCTNDKCVVRMICKRHTAIPNEYYQSFNNFEPKNNKYDSFDCEWLIKTESSETVA